MKTQVYGLDGNALREIELSDAVFGRDVSEGSIYHAIRNELANRRLGTAKIKDRGEVQGSGKKPWKQKGTGRARSGSSRSPLWRHGGTVFGPHPRSYEYGVPKAVRRQALLAALTTKAQAGAVRVLESLNLDRPSTKSMLALLTGAGIQGKTLVVLSARDEVLEKSARNLPTVRVLTVRGLNVYDVLRADTLVLTPEGVQTVREVLGA